MFADADRRYLDLLKGCLTASIYDESAWSLARTHCEVRASQSVMHRFLAAAFGAAAKRSWHVVKTKSYNDAKRHEGADWPLFGYTMVGHKRLNNVQTCIEDVVTRSVPGDLVETGVWRGGTVIFMRAVLKALQVNDRKVWAADSFEGLPRPTIAIDDTDFSSVDYFKVSLEEVQSNFRRFELLDEQVQFLKGWFCDTLPVAPIERISVLRLDGDLYSSTMDALTALYHRVSRGGYVIIDDYGSWESCRRAVHDFFDSRGEKPEIRKIDFSGAYLQVQ